MQEKRKLFAVMDESFSDKSGVFFYVIAASIFQEPRNRVEKVFIEFLLGAKIFKTNRLNTRKRFGRIVSALIWNRENLAINICSWEAGEVSSQESSRQYCLAKLLIELSNNEVFRCVMDSRANPAVNDVMAQNRVDLRTLELLKEELLINSKIELIHLTDHQCPLIGTADAVSWSARKFLIGDTPEYWNVISGNSILI